MASLHVAFDPLQSAPLGTVTGGHRRPINALDGAADAESDDLEAEHLPQEMRMSLESSLEALAQEDAATGEAGEAEAALEGFDLGEVDSDDGGGAVRRSAKGNPQWFSFSLRNVVLACGLVVGGFVLLWTHDLVSPAAGSGQDGAAVAGATHRAVPRVTEATTVQASNPLAPGQPPAPPSPKLAVNQGASAPAAEDAAAQVTGTNGPEESATDGPSVGLEPKPVQAPAASGDASRTSAPLSGPGQGNAGAATVVPLASPSESQPDGSERARLSDVANGGANGGASLASRNGGPFIPGSGSHLESAPVVALPATAPFGPGDDGQAVPLPLIPGSQPTGPRKPGRQRPRMRPRGDAAARQPGPNGAAPFPAMGGPKMRGRDAKPTAFPH